MHKLIFTLGFAASLFLAAHSAWAINKCTVNGEITYTDLPCSTQAISQPFTQPVIPPNDPAAAKRQYLMDKKNLQQLEQQRMKQEQRQQHQEHMQAQQIKRNEEREFKCKRLASKKHAAQQHYAKMQFKGRSDATEKAQLRVKQAEDLYQHYCKAD